MKRQDGGGGAGRFAMVPEHVARTLASKPVLLAVYTMHALFGDYQARTSTATQAHIGALVGRSIRTVRRIERQLAELGLVRRERLKRGRRLTLLDGTAGTDAAALAGATTAADMRSTERPPYQSQQQQNHSNDALARWGSYNSAAARVAAMPEGEAKQAARAELQAMLARLNRGE